MGTIADKLTYLNGTKQAIKQAIIDKGVDVADTDTFRSYADKIGQITSGGGALPVPQSDKGVFFYDYNGDLLHWYSVEDAQALAELPPINVTHERLVSDGWTHTLDEVKATTERLNVGAMYHTESGNFEYKVVIDYPNMICTLPWWGDTIDWGDGTTTTEGQTHTHTYAEAGTYWVQIPSINEASEIASASGIGVVKEAYIAGATVIPADALSYSELVSVVIPMGVTSIRSLAFNQCYQLKFVVIPTGVTNISNGAFNLCALLPTIVIPESVTSIQQSAFSSSGITSLVLPKRLTSLSAKIFSSCINLPSLTIPETVTNIYEGVFYNCI